MDNNFDIYWTAINDATYMYGTRLYFDTAAHFYNPLVPAGTVIHAWYMTSNYDRDRMIPTLPILKQNTRYELTVDMTCVPNNSAYLKLIIYAPDQTVLATHLIEDETYEFIYPDGAYLYTLQLMSASSESITFRKINIRACDDRTTQTVISPCINPVDGNIKTFVFEEPTAVRAYHLRKHAIAHLHNVYIVRLRLAEDITHVREAIDSVPGVHCFVSYGPKGRKVVQAVAQDEVVIDLFDATQLSPLQSVAAQSYRLKDLSDARIRDEVSRCQK